jgi:competence protein ComEA
VPSDSESPVRLGRTVGAVSDRLGLNPSSVIAGALAVLAAAGAVWWALRAPDPPPVESILPAAGSVTIATPAPTTTVPPPMVVHVDGAVNRPGVHELAPGARVIDAVAAAGGTTAAADEHRVNLAAPVVDGQRLWVPAVGEEEPTVVAGSGGGGGGETASDIGSGPVDVNEADETRLQDLPGIGPALAAAIIQYRTDHGPFGTVEDLLDVPGIGPAKLAQLEAQAIT